VKACFGYKEHFQETNINNGMCSEEMHNKRVHEIVRQILMTLTL